MFVVAMVAAPERSFGQGYINVIQGIGPVNYSPSFVNDFAYAALNGLPSYGSWNTIPNGSPVEVSSIFNNNNATGDAMYYGLIVTNSTPFTLASVVWSATNNFGSYPGGTFGEAGVSYTMEGIGINGSTVYSSGNSTTPVYAIYVLGVNYSLDIGNNTTQGGVVEWAPSCPIDFAVTYTAAGMSGTWDTEYVIPEPSALAIATLGGLSLMAFARGRKK